MNFGEGIAIIHIIILALEIVWIILYLFEKRKLIAVSHG